MLLAKTLGNLVGFWRTQNCWRHLREALETGIPSKNAQVRKHKNWCDALFCLFHESGQMKSYFTYLDVPEIQDFTCQKATEIRGRRVFGRELI